MMNIRDIEMNDRDFGLEKLSLTGMTGILRYDYNNKCTTEEIRQEISVTSKL